MGGVLRLPQIAVPKDAARQMKRVQRQALLKWPFGGITLESTLKTSKEASVFRGYRGTEPVVVKKFWDRGTRLHFVGGTVHALKRFDDLGGHEKYSVNKYFASSGHLGLMVVSFEPGTPVDQLLKQSAANRSDVIRRCCAWQDWAGQGKIAATALPADRFTAEINSVLAASTDHPDASLLAELGDELLQMLAEFGERPALRGPGHPDFAPRNLILRPDGGVAAIDIHRSGTFFRSRQAAIFLVSKDFQSKDLDGSLIYGLDEAELRQFLARSNAPEEEAESFLVFFIGLTFLRMYAKKIKRVRRMRIRHARIQGFLKDLRQGRRIVP
ncbi:hypothetical protein [Leisingera methylohalidivorans]|uniref:Aminoglycoside phosphotransferase domain-containing protein n=1 Tax=Leisingera methylohalidivorans DSM 14336 TaxID=999552 RepID=V9VVS9_9RHOB|nr:hypothetical protein [Leisingera methylohalidivorans]AHD02851.1 hypothetical protein METH_02920 [Leisingera methylohalidivorans DSM 14336]